MSSKSKLSAVDRGLTLWILLAMAAGLLLGRFVPAWGSFLTGLEVGNVSIPLALGLILMMYPPLAKVRYDQLDRPLKKPKLLALSLIQNWIVGPVLMMVLAILFLHQQPGYLLGVVLVGLARCIAMVLVWNDLSGGSREWGTGLVALNAVFQILFYAVYIWLFLAVILPATGVVPEAHVRVSFLDSASSVLVYLGIPFAAGFFSRIFLSRWKGAEWYEKRFLPRISPLTLVFLLFTVVVMFSLQGQRIVEQPWDVGLVALPYLVYFALFWIVTFALARLMGGTHEESTAVAFSSASNDFELAIAVAIALWGAASPQAFATVIGPLIEVPVMVLLVRLAQGLKKGGVQE
ncbi:MAG: ACR3 family arsenite efflux transporter [Spirochaetales bacterium]|nr:ACR3 family arsenite efflux transporter [Spirochaetales bacterium]